MRTFARAILSLLVVAGGPALAQSTPVPVCNAFDVNGNPVYASGTTTTTSCTDYFGAGNWANSPLPAGSIAGFTVVAGGSGYVNPVVVIGDPTGGGATATIDPGTQIDGTGAIMGVTPGVGGSGYIIPQVTIVDVGALGALGAPTCGGAGQPACGSGAIVTASVGPPFTGGMKKFQDAFRPLPIATPDQATFPGSDYYEIGLVQYAQQMHGSLPPTTLRGYVQLKTGSVGCSPTSQLTSPSYLGPSIIAWKDRPVRVKFTNCLPTGGGGDLFIPTDTTYMGAGMGNGLTYTQNRATLHLHGGVPPWISDGTPHQWTVPVGEAAAGQRGDSVGMVPDMWFLNGLVVPQCSATVTTNCSDPTGANLPAGASNDPGQGSLTFFWTNQQGGRLMFYHDHAYGLTRLNVYAGEAAGYLLLDPVEENALAAGSAPGTMGTTADSSHLIALVIQDKTFVPSQQQLAAQDPTWAGNYGISPLVAASPATPNGNGDLWFPHVYMPNQDPADPSLSNAFGRWDYGPWFYPPQTSLTAASPTPADVTVNCTSKAFPGQLVGPTSACPTCGCPIIPNPSGTPESFMDTPVVNGVAYPVMHVAPAAYRFQILSAANDRSLNLSWFVADPATTDAGPNTEVTMMPAVPPTSGSPLPLCSAVNTVTNPGLVIGMPKALLDNAGNPLNGTGLQAGCWPNYGPQPGIPAPQTMWAADGRAGGAPDPRNAGPAWIQIGTEGGLLPAPVVIPPTPVNYEQNVRSITIGSVAVHGLWLGTAERADVIVDFSRFAGKTLVLYNDAPTPAPALDSRLDYFTNDGDQSPIGGAPNTPPGYGPNTRTIMQVVVDANDPNLVKFSLPALKAAFSSTATTAGAFAATQPVIVVPEAGYSSAYNQQLTNNYASISATNMVFTPLAGPLTLATPVGITSTCPSPALPAQCANFGEKTIQELFTLDYGRMNATLGTELPLTNFLTQTTIPLGYVDPPTEIIRQGDTQLWKITHNGVDTHFIHFHLFNVQVINRVGWDGSLRAPDANELGWKDTVRMNPLEDIYVALQPVTPTLPFPMRNSVRLLDVTAPAGACATCGTPTSAFTDVNPFDNNPTTTVNGLQNFGWEYVWHCHILGHEENDMMRPIVYQVPPPVPTGLLATASNPVTLTWIDNAASETGYTVQRSIDGVNWSTIATVTASAYTASAGLNAAQEGTTWGATVTHSDPLPSPGTYSYRVQAVDDGFSNASGMAQSYNGTGPVVSGWSQIATAVVTGLSQNVTLTAPQASAAYGAQLAVTATTDAGVIPTITAGGACSVGAVSGTPTSATATVTMTSGTGTCTLIAAWPGTAFYMNATSSTTVTALLATPAVQLVGVLASAAYNTTFGVAATSSADTTMTVMPTITGTPGVCTVSAPGGSPTNATATVTMTSGTGTCTLTASWAATANYAAASATQTTTATLATPTVGFTGAPASAANGAQFTVAATTNAGVAPTITSANTGVCTVGAVTGTSPATATVTMTSGTGTCALTASWPATTSYAAATAGQATTATLRTPTVAFTGAPASAAYTSSFTVSATTNADVLVLPTIAATGACSVTIPSGSPTSATAMVTMTSGSGTCTVTASWPATGNYAAASLVQATAATKLASTATIISVSPNPVGVSQLATIQFSVTSAVALVNGFTGPSGAVTVFNGGQTCTGTLTPGSGATPSTGSCTLSFPSTGTKTLTATYAADANFNASTSAAVTEQVGDFSITASPSARTVTGGSQAKYTIAVTSLSGLTGSVALSCQGVNLPAGWSCSVSPTSLTLSARGASATMTVSTATGNKGKTYTVTTTGSYAGSPALTHSANVGVTTK